jgi:hypothetical protein
VNLGGILPGDFPGYRGQFDYLQPVTVYRPLEKWWYYPYYYFPHSYWPTNGPRWPERPGEHTVPAPAYMAYPPFHEPHWRYELWQQARYYKGFHFWLDQF